MSIFSWLKNLSKNEGKGVKGTKGAAPEILMKGSRPDAVGTPPETILNPKQGHGGKERAGCSGTVIRKRPEVLADCEIDGQSAGNVARESSDHPTEIKPDGVKEETLLKDRGTVVRKGSPELSGLEMAEQGAWQVKEVRVWEKGDVILDTYKVEDVIKTGGMGYVYIAEHQKWKVKMAIKSPNEDMLSDRSLFSRVLKEADTWTGLGLHPHIACCYYVRKIDDVPHIFIKYVDGGNLREWISDVRCYDLKVGLDIAIQFCHGMEHAHKSGKIGMIHRDIKPENILMTKDATVKVTDFGIARGGGDKIRELVPDGEGKRDRDVGKKEGNLTTFGTRMGTYDYMSPEQYEDAHNVDKRADIYSFGVCLYEMFCGRKPYGTASQVAASVIAKEEKRQAHEPRALREDLPADLALLLKKCCHLERDGRYSSFEEVRKELVRIYHDLFHEEPPHEEIELIESKADVLNNRAISYLDLGREDKAVECWQEALREDPHHLEATFNYGYFRWQRGEILSDVIVTHMKDLQDSYGTNPDYWRLLAWIHLERGDIEEIEKITNSGYRIEDKDFLKAYHDKDRPIGRYIFTLEGHTGDVESVSFSPDGHYALSGSNDRTMRLWDIESGKEIRQFQGHTGDVESVSFSPDGRYALSGAEYGDYTIRLWEIETGKELRRFEWGINQTTFVSFAPHSRSDLLVIQNKVISLRDIESLREIKRFKVHTRSVYSFSLDSRYALSDGGGGFGDYTIRLWETETGKELRRFQGHTGVVFSACFSPDSRYALSGGDTTIRLWEIETGKEIRKFEGHTDGVKSVSFSPDGRYALSGSWDKTIRLWDIESGKEIRQFKGHTEKVTSVSFSPDGHYALSGSWDNTIRLWEIYYPPKDWGMIHIFPFLSKVKDVKNIIRDSDRVEERLKSARDLINEGSFHKGYTLLKEAQIIPGYERNREILTLLALCGIEGKGKRRGLKDAWHFRTFEGHTVIVTSVSFSPDSRHALSGSNGGTIRLWDIESGKEIRKFEGHSNIVFSISFSPDSRHALSGGGTISLWDIETGKEIWQFEGHKGFVWSIKFSPDSRYALSGGGETIRLWDIESGKEIRKFEGHSNIVSSVSFSPDGRHALSGSEDKTIRLWDIESGKEIRQFKGHTEKVASVSFSPDVRHALSGSEDKTIRLWDIESGKEIRQFKGHTEKVTSVSFSPDGHYALSGSWDETIRLWDIESGKEIRQFKGHR